MAGNPSTIFSPATLRELSEIGSKAEEHVDGALAIDQHPVSRRYLAYSPQAMQELRNSYAVLRDAMKAIEQVARSRAKAVKGVEDDLREGR